MHAAAAKPIYQFTATPFREDGGKVDGKFIYYYPLAKAQAEGYFGTVAFKAVSDLEGDEADDEIMRQVGEALERDLKAGFNRLHHDMARVPQFDGSNGYRRHACDQRSVAERQFCRQLLIRPFGTVFGLVRRRLHQAEMVRHRFGSLFHAIPNSRQARNGSMERLRAEAARPRVEEGAEPMDAIARHVGFGDLERMRRSFVRIFGRSPMAMRRSARKSTDDLRRSSRVSHP
jgi:AraC-like DNA-binding protein